MIYIRPKLKTDQTGFVSIVVTMILMIVLGLIIIGFLQIANREQREALDRQLSTQAFYAAESGVNDAIFAYNKGAFTGTKTNCAPNALLSPNGTVLNAAAGVSYTCLQIQSALKTLNYTVHKTSTIVPINSAVMQTLHLSWQSTDSPSTFSNQFTSGPNGSPLFPTSTTFVGNSGVLAISLIPLDQLNRPSINTNTLNAFLYPENTGAGLNGSLDMGAIALSSPPAQGVVVTGKCHVSNAVAPLYACNVLITNLQHKASGYILRVRSLYRDSLVVICGSDIVNSATCDSTFTGAQLQVDATGKANDVLRRIQERYPLNGTDLRIPEFAVESADEICKTLQVTNVTPYATDDPDCPTLPKIDD